MRGIAAHLSYVLGLFVNLEIRQLSVSAHALH
jgi:hypothetical protein